MKRGLFSVSYAGLWGQATLQLRPFIRHAAELGFEGVLLMGKRPHLSPLDCDRKTMKRLRSDLQAAGVRMIGVAAYNDFLLEAPGEVPALEMQIAYVEACARLSAELGGELVRVFTGYTHQRGAYAAQWQKVVGALQECADRASRHGIRLAVQNHHDLAVGTELMHDLIHEVDRDNCRAGFDAWSLFLRGEDLEAAAGKMAGLTALTIAANYRTYPRYRYVPELVNYEPQAPDYVRAVSMQEGQIDYRAFLRALAAGGFDGWCVYEMCSPLQGGPALENLDAKAKAYLELMRSLGL